MLHNYETRVFFEKAKEFNVKFENVSSFANKFDEIMIIDKLNDVEKYDGACTVVPKANQEQVLETKDKYVTSNIVVTKVPFYETSNDSGKTIYIASEVM